MPSQQLEIAEAIFGIKRALKRQREAPSDRPVVAASNRGNKLHQGAKYVHEGSLTYSSGPEVYKQKIEHAGYTRYILERNPRRYNEYGEELEDSETDEEADADAADQNAYSGIHLEELLCPLKHPSDLPIHPTMSPAYLSTALPDMVLSTHDKLRQERANLWRAKYLNRELTGDVSWIPAGAVESAADWDLFEPRSKSLQKESGRKRKRQPPGDHCQNGTVQTERHGVSKVALKSKKENVFVQTNSADGSDMGERKDNIRDVQATTGDAANGIVAPREITHGATGSADLSSSAAVKEQTINMRGKSEPNALDLTPANQYGREREIEGRQNQETVSGIHHDRTSQKRKYTGAKQVLDEAFPTDNGSPLPPLRHITGALAANNNANSHSNAPTPPLSPASSSTTTSSSSELQIDPLYLVPQSANPSHAATAFYGLLPEEALETRRLLTLYIQKQEESVRGYEAILSKLLTAQRLRSEVLEMCKTEEHVGELSDGEDWIDIERWGLQPGELRKGRDEDDDVIEESTIGGRKGKRRARN